ncbi:heat-shock protein HslJ, partial [Shigella flexneri]|nr:heat-shock protein HslJ [Shigella flexneri]
MKKVAAFVALSLLMAGCVSNDKIAVTPEISFGEKMMISGSMCNRF